MHRSLRVIVVGLLFSLCVVLLAAGSFAVAAPAATTWYVGPLGEDSNDCLAPGSACETIAAAVGKATAGDTIQIAAGIYSEHDIRLNKALTLNGAGMTETIIDADAAGRVVYIAATTVISGMRMQNGQTPESTYSFDEYGGAVFVGNGMRATLKYVALMDNTASSGGAIFNYGFLELENTEILSNTAAYAAGGIQNYTNGVITITRSTLAHNVALGASSGGGGIQSTGKSLTIRNTTLHDNGTAYFGGALFLGQTGPTLLDGVTLSGNTANAGAAVYAYSGAITATNTTLSGNIANNDFGGMYLSNATTSVLLRNCTIAHNARINTGVGGTNGLCLMNGATATLVNTVFANNDQANCSTATVPTSLGHNLSDDGTCGLTQPGDQLSTDPMLAPLSDYGGFVETHTLLPGSPAIDAGDATQCPPTDARGIARPFDGDNDAVAVCDIGAVEARHQIAIADHAILEGDSGTDTAVFTVTLTPTSTLAVQVDYATADGTATGGMDYKPVSGTLTFDPGQTQKIVSVLVLGDTNDELDETFSVALGAAINADLLDGEATGTIVDDDGLPVLTITDQSTVEGNAGSKLMQFTVTLSPPGPSVVTVAYATADASAVAGSDYTAASGALTYQPGETSQTIAVTILGDVVDEGAAETFTVRLSSPVSATLTVTEAVGTITDDDDTRVSYRVGPRVREGNSGVTPAVFTATLSTPAAFTVTVDYELRPGVTDSGALAGEDYVDDAGTLTFAPGDTIETHIAQVLGDEKVEPDENFGSLLSNANVTLGANSTTAWILNDDFRIYLPVVQRQYGASQ